MALNRDLIATFSAVVAFLAFLHPTFDKFGLWDAKKKLFQYIVVCVTIVSILAACVSWIRMRNVIRNRFLEFMRHWCSLISFLPIILYIFTFKMANIVIIEEKPYLLSELKQCLNTIFQMPILLMCTHRKNCKPDILPYAPAIIDIYDGLELLTSRSNEASLEWIHVAICLAVITFCIPAFLEIYHINYPDRRVLSRQSIRLAHVFCGSVFLAVRTAVAVIVKNPHDILFLYKGCFSVTYHYETFVNQRRMSKIVQVEATEMSTEERASLANSGQSWYHTSENIEIKLHRCDEICILIDPATINQGTKLRNIRKRSKSF